MSHGDAEPPMEEAFRVPHCSVSQLVAELRATAGSVPRGGRYWIGLAGAPGSGKSTLASRLKAECHDLITVIPMDGYHFSRNELATFQDAANAFARRGAPLTFDAERFVSELAEAKRRGIGRFPSFDHGVGDPVADQVVLDRSSGVIVLVEGNYLLLDEPPWHRLRRDVFDETWFLDVDLQTCNRRVFDRHVATGSSAAEAQLRVEKNDALNAELVIASSRHNADRVFCVDYRSDDSFR